MAVKVPLKLVGNDIKPMSSGEVNALITRAIYAYSLNPAVTLSRVSSGGNLGTITDTRLQAGAGSTRVDRYPTEAETANVSTNSISFSRINQSVANPSYPQGFEMPFLTYVTPNGDIKGMTYEDLFDTIVYPAINLLSSSSLTANQAGTYFISTSTSVSGATIVDSNPVFTDTTANSSLYTAGGIPEALDQPTVVNNYYLHVLNGDDTKPAVSPLILFDDGDLKEAPITDFDYWFQKAIRYAVVNDTGYRLRYSYTSGNNRGTMMVDTVLDSSTYRTRFVNADDYRAQEHPSGSSSIANTYYLKINQS